MRIASFRNKALQRLWSSDNARGLPPEQVRRLRLALSAISAATNMRMLASVPGWRLHALKGERAGMWSMSITGNWRLTFRLEGETVHDIALEDYH
ncbi:MAG TPA: type II toxin-antitoxin system RelE/ParE family toxin [Rhizomicrobium sp.]|jgi:proteic killer suppression protein|nr:type II toxin-antitoxin system RelE/ParE family toxin [Rhizomicrobium sp.]